MTKRDTSQIDHTNQEQDEEPEEAGTFPLASKEELEKRVMLKGRRQPEHIETDSHAAVFSEFPGFEVSVPTTGIDFSSLNGMFPKAFSFSPGDIFSSYKATCSTQTTATVTTSIAADSHASCTATTSVFSTIASIMPRLSFFNSFPDTTLSTPATVTPISTASHSTTGDNHKSTVPSLLSLAKSVLPYMNHDSRLVTTSRDTASTKSEKSCSHPKSLPRNVEFFQKLKALNESVILWISRHVKEDPYCILVPVFSDYEKYYRELDRAYPSTNANSSLSSVLQPMNNMVTSIASHFGSSFGGVDSSVRPQLLLDVPDVLEELKPCSVTVSGCSKITECSSLNEFLCKNDQKKLIPESLFTANIPVHISDNDAERDEQEIEAPESPPPFALVSEDEAFYSQRCKLFYKAGNQYILRGNGMLNFKHVGEKTQLLIIADTKSRTILLNVILNTSIMSQVIGSNHVLLICVPNPPLNLKSENLLQPVSMLLKMKSPEEAQEVFEIISKCKSS